MLELLAIGLGIIWIAGLVLAVSLCRVAAAGRDRQPPRRARPIAG